VGVVMKLLSFGSYRVGLRIKNVAYGWEEGANCKSGDVARCEITKMGPSIKKEKI
jgi:hypothetical protein